MSLTQIGRLNGEADSIWLVKRQRSGSRIKDIGAGTAKGRRGGLKDIHAIKDMPPKTAFLPSKGLLDTMITSSLSEKHQ